MNIVEFFDNKSNRERFEKKVMAPWCVSQHKLNNNSATFIKNAFFVRLVDKEFEEFTRTRTESGLEPGLLFKPTSETVRVKVKGDEVYEALKSNTICGAFNSPAAIKLLYINSDNPWKKVPEDEKKTVALEAIRRRYDVLITACPNGYGVVATKNLTEAALKTSDAACFGYIQNIMYDRVWYFDNPLEYEPLPIDVDFLDKVVEDLVEAALGTPQLDEALARTSAPAKIPPLKEGREVIKARTLIVRKLKALEDKDFGLSAVVPGFPPPEWRANPKKFFTVLSVIVRSRRGLKNIERADKYDSLIRRL